MMEVRQDLLRAIPMAANTSVTIGERLSAFLAVTAGTITVTDADTTVLLNAFPVAAGDVVPIPIKFKTPRGGTVALAGGASGTLLV